LGNLNIKYRYRRVRKMIKWFDTERKSKTCVATIYDSNITLNKHACDLIDNAYTVMLGLDYDKKMLFIKPLSKDAATRGDIPASIQYNITIRSSYGRISNVDFIKEIKGIIGVDSFKANPKKFNVEYSSSMNTLTIDLTKEV
jgi:hypothetical protein